jgi:hypothetical protein
MKIPKSFLGASTLLMVSFCSFALAQRPGGPPRQRPDGPPPFERPDGPPDGPPNGPRPPRHKPDGALDFASIELLGGGRVVKGLPYTAEAVIESTQTLRDGTSISRKSTTSVARDGEGRLRRERTLDAIGPFIAAEGPRTLIVIDDPVLGAHFVFDVENKTVRKIRNPMPPPGEGLPPGDVDEARGEFAEGKIESLGTRSMDGVDAEGTRSTITIPAGAIGNDRVIEIVSERWYSPTLQAVLISKHTDPRMGDIVYRLTNIKRGEPDATLFKVPADYKLIEGQGPPPPGKPGRPGGEPGMGPMGPPPPRNGRGPGRP